MNKRNVFNILSATCSKPKSISVPYGYALRGPDVLVGGTRVQMEWIATAAVPVFGHGQRSLFEFETAYGAQSLKTDHRDTVCAEKNNNNQPLRYSLYSILFQSSRNIYTN